ncbi:unnamed protein product [Echinostoma caproni]|uniref:MTTase N-terminal domain-containing protein n=1 Tax=Echinostoma caproni TaxID=27848 RepID=A0A183ATI1_9TREM|nr:unnamed protein product [Echinostoma caproni]
MHPIRPVIKCSRRCKSVWTMRYNRPVFLANPFDLVFFEVYGCQMNHSDTQIARSILQQAGFREAPSVEKANTVLLMTCAIRESAELKIWKRLHHLRLLSNRHNLHLRIGILGCMAERLKERLLTQSLTDPDNPVNFVCGPDAYRNLPQLIQDAHAGQCGASVTLSLEETYADITPVSKEKYLDVALISVMRGCDNMCTYCIVPFVRGRERSRPLRSIVDEARQLVDEGVKEVTLLGQNVNSYCDRSADTVPLTQAVSATLSPGFRTVYRPKQGGWRFVDLLDEVSRISPELRVRFTSPHPKDFPVLQLIGERANICSHLHLPAQSGSRTVLERMGRGYSPEAYLNLVHTVRQIIPGKFLRRRVDCCRSHVRCVFRLQSAKCWFILAPNLTRTGEVVGQILLFSAA